MGGAGGSTKGGLKGQPKVGGATGRQDPFSVAASTTTGLTGSTRNRWMVIRLFLLTMWLLRFSYPDSVIALLFGGGAVTGRLGVQLEAAHGSVKDNAERVLAGEGHPGDGHPGHLRLMG